MFDECDLPQSAPAPDSTGPCVPLMPIFIPASCDSIVRGYYNAAQSYTADCPDGFFSNPVTVTVPKNTFFSYVSQDEVDSQALDAAQADATSQLVCTSLFYSQAVVQDCPFGQVGPTVTIPAGTYGSFTSQQDADDQAFAAAEAALVCHWENQTLVMSCPEGQVGESEFVTIPAGTYTSDVSQEDADAQADAAAEEELNCRWPNIEVTFDCPFGEVGDSVTIPAGTYLSAVSQQDADDQASAAAQAALDCHWENTILVLNCPDGYTGDAVTIPAGTYTSDVSQEDADAQAMAAAEAALDCVLDEFTPGVFDGPVFDFDFQSTGKVVVVGGFLAVDGTGHSGISRLNADGSTDDSFSATITGGTGLVDSVVVLSDDKIVVGGRFTTVNGVARRGLAVLNSDGTLYSAFDAALNNDLGGSNGCLSLDSSGRILAVGAFSSAFGVAVSQVVRIATDLTHDTSFVGTVISSPYGIQEAASGKVYVYGSGVRDVGGLACGIRRLNSDGSTDDVAFNGNFGGSIAAMGEQSDGSLVLGGLSALITLSPLVSVDNIERCTSTGARDAAFAGSVVGGSTNPIEDIWMNGDNTMYVGGNFTAINGSTRNRICKLDADGNLDATFNPNANARVYRIKVRGGFIWIGGLFSTIGGQAQRGIARLNSDGTVA